MKPTERERLHMMLKGSRVHTFAAMDHATEGRKREAIRLIEWSERYLAQARSVIQGKEQPF